jgi:hypothetical protein
VSAYRADFAEAQAFSLDKKFLSTILGPEEALVFGKAPVVYSAFIEQ